MKRISLWRTCTVEHAKKRILFLPNDADDDDDDDDDDSDDDDDGLQSAIRNVWQKKSLFAVQCSFSIPKYLSSN